MPYKGPEREGQIYRGPPSTYRPRPSAQPDYGPEKKVPPTDFYGPDEPGNPPRDVFELKRMDEGYRQGPPPNQGYRQGPPPNQGYRQGPPPNQGYRQGPPPNQGYRQEPGRGPPPPGHPQRQGPPPQQRPPVREYFD